MPKILIVDDDRGVCASLSLLLSKSGYEVYTVHHPSGVEEAIVEFDPHVVLLDMNFTIDTSGRQGLSLLRQIRMWNSRCSVILMTGWATVQLAVEGMKLGARDFIAKPWENKDLLQSVRDILHLHHPESPKVSKEEEQEFRQLIGESDAIQEIMNIVRNVAPTSASVLITGESGVGKEMVAEAIHAHSKRNAEAFVKVNLGAVPTELFESEMYGHRKGAFTGAHEDRDGRFASAQKGTIFLDEIGELATINQVKLLRVLQEKTFDPVGSDKSIKSDVRVISASNRSLLDMVNDGEFREDLYYRINLIRINIPSLSERREDIPLLVKHFSRLVESLHDLDAKYISPEAIKWLAMQDYPGNIRQLKNIVERTILLSGSKRDIGIKEFQSCFDKAAGNKTRVDGLNLQELEIKAIDTALRKYNHSISEASRALGITRSSLYRRIEKYDIRHEPPR